MTVLVDILADVYDGQEFLREAIQVIIVKILKSKVASVVLFDEIVTKFKLTEAKALSLSAYLSLFFALRAIYHDKFSGESKIHDALMNFEVVSNKKHLQSVRDLVKTQTYLFPRLHSSAILVIK